MKGGMRAAAASCLLLALSATGQEGPPPALALSGGRVYVAGRDAKSGAARLFSFSLRDAPLGEGPARTLDPGLSSWEAVRAIDAARPYGSLLPAAALRDLGLDAATRPVRYWPGRCLLGLSRVAEREVLVPLPLAEQSPREAAAAREPAVRAGFGPPVLLAAPNDLFALSSDVHGYGRFLAENRRRRHVLFAVDALGALHAFDAGTAGGDAGSGAEVWAVEPPSGGSAEASELSYGDVFVDAPWASGGRPCPPETGSTGSGCQWRTLLGYRRGGTLTMLDVTQPDSGNPASGAPDCLVSGRRPPGTGCSAPYPSLAWTYSADQGGEVTAPAFGRLRSRTSDGHLRERAVVVIGTVDRGRPRAAGRLVILDAGNGSAVMAFSAGVARQGKSPEPRAMGPFLAPPVPVDADGDGVLDAVVAGDAQGHLWIVRLGTPAGEPVRRPVAELLFDGSRDASGDPLCSDRDPSGVCPAAAIARAPSVFRRGDGGELGAAFAAGTAGSGAAPSVIVLPALPERALGRSDLATLVGAAAPALGGCDAPAPARMPGWSVRLEPGESVVTATRVLSGSLWFGTRGGGGIRLWRLDAGNGDPCRGAECCPGAPAAWLGAAGRPERTVPVTRAAAARVSDLRIAFGPRGELRAVLLLQDPSGEKLSLFSRTIPTRLAVREAVAR